MVGGRMAGAHLEDPLQGPEGLGRSLTINIILCDVVSSSAQRPVTAETQMDIIVF